MTRTRVKICGITRIEDAITAIDAGADALGFVFYAASPRSIAVAAAAQIIKQLPPFISCVGLFVNADKTQVEQTLQHIPLNLLQFHGEESADYCQQFDRPYMKAIRMRPEINLLNESNIYQDAQALLLDAYVKGIKGGTGTQFQWSLIPKNLPLPVVLAGGLSADNVAAAIKEVKPWAVDVSGGVEASKGIKDVDKIYQFMQQSYLIV